MSDRKKILVSSTILDLPEHRATVLNACLRQGMFPLTIEYLPVSDKDAVEACLQMVDEADIYLGVFAYRYGYVPLGREISITEMEYNRAVERDIPCLIFIMDEGHQIRVADVDVGEGADKLERLKEKVKAHHMVATFTSAEDLGAKILYSLSEYRDQYPTVFHYNTPIPTPPETYIAQPYTLLQTKSLVGRQAELNLLTSWVAGTNPDASQARLFCIVAIGGIGKSALTWKWFNEIAQQEMKPLAGRMWWSFCESEASFENFVTRALAYVMGKKLEEVQRIPAPERELQLLAVLDREPYLITLDGLERLLIAYSRVNIARLSDEELDQQTGNLDAQVTDSTENGSLFRTVSQHPLRKTVDPRAGSFLRRLAGVSASRILISTRLYPADLQTHTGQHIPGSYPYRLGGLSDDDAVNLWRSFDVTGSREALLPMFHAFQNHALLIQALANEVANYRRAPGNFDRWQKDHPGFDPFNLSRDRESKTHLLTFALRGLDEVAREVLEIVAAFRMPTTYDTLTALLTGKEKLFKEETQLVTALAGLEDRGLLGWDKRANRYDLHPIVRGAIWSALDEKEKQRIYEVMHDYFAAIPTVKINRVKSLEDLTPTIELYNTLIGLRRYKEASDLFYERLNQVTLFRLSAPRQRAELLELLFPNGIEEPPGLSDPEDQAFILNALGATYLTGGQPRRAASLYRRHNEIRKALDDQDDFCVGLGNLSNALRQSGSLHESELIAQQALVLARELKNQFLEAVNLGWLGISLAVRGITYPGEKALQRSLRIFKKRSQAVPEELKERRDAPAEATANAFLARIRLWSNDPAAARLLIERAWQLVNVEHYERYVILITRMRGAVALASDDRLTAEEYLHKSLVDARAVNLVVEEILALVELAELRWKQGEVKAARELLEDVWELAERGPYPIFHADAYNLLAQIERDEDNTAAAVEAATKAYQLAWCDGPPFAYHWGLQVARKHLSELGAPEPEMPPFDESSFKPMTEVEINPPDEFGE